MIILACTLATLFDLLNFLYVPLSIIISDSSTGRQFPLCFSFLCFFVVKHSNSITNASVICSLLIILQNLLYPCQEANPLNSLVAAIFLEVLTYFFASTSGLLSCKRQSTRQRQRVLLFLSFVFLSSWNVSPSLFVHFSVFILLPSFL